MRLRNAARAGVGSLVLAGAALMVLPSAPAHASAQITDTYDGYANGGAGTQIATGVTSFNLDGITYQTDQPSETWVSTSSTGAPLSSGSSDGVLLMNYQGTAMTWVKISLQNGDAMKVFSFDLDAFASTGTIQLIPDGNSANMVTEPGTISGPVDLSTNANFTNIHTLELLDVGDSGFFTPTLDNFSYQDLSSPPVLTATGGSTSFVAGDNATSTPVAVDSGITLTDGDSSTAVSATVKITGNLQTSEDVLAFTNTSAATYGDISAAYSAGTGTLTLTSSSATASIAQWQAALRAVTYTDTAVTPNASTRTVSFALNDGLSASNTSTKNVTVTDTDQTPVVSSSGGTTNYRSGASATTIDGGVTVSDLDNTTQSSGTVSVSSGFNSGDSLGFTNDGSTMGNIAGSYNAATGVLTLTSSGATATLAQWTSALRAVTFSSTSATTGSRTISFATSDGTKTSSAATDTVNVQPPATLTTDSGSAAFVAGDNATSTPVAVDSGLTVSDTAASTLSSATVSISVGFQSGQDVLAFTNNGSTMGNVTGSYNATTGVLTLTSAGSTATLAQWQSALQSVTYTDTLVTPNTTTRTVSFSYVDSVSNTSNTATRTVTVTATDQTPVVTTTGGTTSYVGGTSAVTIDGGVAVSDLDNTTQSSGTVSVSSGFHSGDTLSFINDGSTMGNISGSYNAATGVLTLTSAGATATNTQWGHALSSVTFNSSSTTYGSRTISFATSDGTKTSSASTDSVNMTAPPVITTDSGSAAFVAGDNTTSTPVAVDSGLTVTDGSATTFASSTVAITGNFHSGEDVLSFTNDGSTMGNITASYNAATGVLTLTSSGATGTLAQWQSALRSVTFTDTAVTPSNATRTVSFTAVDGAGNTSLTATRTVTVTATDQTPVVTATGGTTSYVGGTSAVTIDGGVSVSDLDNTTQSSGTVGVSGGFHSGDVLSFTNDGSTMGNITGSYNAATGVLTLTSSGATATNTQWGHALSSVTFSSSSTTYGFRTISFATSDGTKTSSASTDSVNMTAPPVITTDSGSAAFVAGDNTTSTPVAIDSGLTVADGSAPTLASSTVAVTGSFQAGEDVLGFTNDGSTMGNIAGSYNAATGVLTLTSAGATATLAQWQSALDSVTYTDTAVTPNSATRTVSFTAVDGASNTSNTATRTVTVTATDQTPIVTTTGGTTNYVGGTSAVTIDGGVSVSDLDNTTQSTATVSITAGFHSGDTLTFVNSNSTTFGNIVGSYNAATGVLTLTSSGATASDAQWGHVLSAVTFSASSSAAPGNRTIGFAVNDGTKTSSLATDTIDVLGPPTITTDTGSGSFIEADNATSAPVVVDYGLSVTDGSASTLASATVAITGNFHSGEDVLGFTNDASTMGNIAASYNTATGVLTLTSSGVTASLAQWIAALQAVTYTDTAVTPNTATRTISFTAVDTGSTTSNTAARTVTVTATDQTPIVTTTGGATIYTLGGGGAVIDSGVTVTDADNTTQASATVSITSGFVAGDTLAFTNDGSTMGNITASYDAATGVLALTSAGATASNAEWASALSSVTFSTNATTGDRTVSFATDDGAKVSVAATDTVTVKQPAPPAPTPPTYTGTTRVAGGDRTETSIDASQREFPGPPSTFTAHAVVLVGAADAIDGLTGAPLAAAVQAPILYIGQTAAPASVVAEIQRLLGSSGKVYLLGGPTVVAGSVESQLQSLGYTTERIAGVDRYATAVAIADRVAQLSGAPTAVFEATGLDDADAIVAAPAAAHGSGVVLLTNGNQQSSATSAWLAAHAGITRYAVGGPAVAADPSATPIRGADRYATSVDVARTFFGSASGVALANGTAWPDAAVAAASSALNGAPLLLVTVDTLPSVVTAWLSANSLSDVAAYGGPTRISTGVLNSVTAITGLPLQ